ncbi:MAG: Glycosylphosphatidylinositol (GPI) anchor assembly protein [Candelina submexicana]|nr:MAG: Glycosylphosphatidylinositol (GPI) anchor assembly protein [Candelina submexicana]
MAKGTMPSASRQGSKPGQRKKSQTSNSEQGAFGRMFPAVLSLSLAFTIGTPLLTIILILFGAPLTTHMQHNLLCAAHVSLLAAFPLIYVYGVDTRRWREVAAVMLPFDEVFGGTIGTFVGAWLGAVPIPLDWDREWQKWPVTIVTGAYLGYFVGKFAGGYLLKGKRIQFD